jgi:hypothetical protein
MPVAFLGCLVTWLFNQSATHFQNVKELSPRSAPLREQHAAISDACNPRSRGHLSRESAARTGIDRLFISPFHAPTLHESTLPDYVTLHALHDSKGNKNPRKNPRAHASEIRAPVISISPVTHSPPENGSSPGVIHMSRGCFSRYTRYNVCTQPPAWVRSRYTAVTTPVPAVTRPPRTGEDSNQGVKPTARCFIKNGRVRLRRALTFPVRGPSRFRARAPIINQPPNPKRWGERTREPSGLLGLVTPCGRGPSHPDQRR